jgi:hypothetical protein
MTRSLSPEHDADHREADERSGCSCATLKIASQSAIATDRRDTIVRLRFGKTAELLVTDAGS